MPIANVARRGSLLVIYDEKGHPIGQVLAGELRGFTGSTVSVERNNMLITYNERGMQISAIPSRA